MPVSVKPKAKVIALITGAAGSLRNFWQLIFWGCYYLVVLTSLQPDQVRDTGIFTAYQNLENNPVPFQRSGTGYISKMANYDHSPCPYSRRMIL